MAFSQIDPARLNGEALKQWYLRSPADIEEERQQAPTSSAILHMRAVSVLYASEFLDGYLSVRSRLPRSLFFETNLFAAQ